MEKDKKQQSSGVSDSSEETVMRTTKCSIHDATVPIRSSIRKAFPMRYGQQGGEFQKNKQLSTISPLFRNFFPVFHSKLIMVSLERKTLSEMIQRSSEQYHDKPAFMSFGDGAFYDIFTYADVGRGVA